MSTRHSTPDHYGSADFAFFARPCAAFKTFSGLTLFDALFLSDLTSRHELKPKGQIGAYLAANRGGISTTCTDDLRIDARLRMGDKFHKTQNHANARIYLALGLTHMPPPARRPPFRPPARLGPMGHDSDPSWHQLCRAELETTAGHSARV